MTKSDIDHNERALAMTLVLGSLVMLNASILLVAAIARIRSTSWIHPNLLSGLIATSILVFSNVSVGKFNNFSAENPTFSTRAHFATFALAAIVFLVLEISLWHRQTFSDPSFQSYELLVGVHIVQALVGAIGLIISRARNSGSLRAWSLYWHGISLLWCAIFLSLWVI